MKKPGIRLKLSLISFGSLLFFGVCLMLLSIIFIHRTGDNIANISIKSLNESQEENIEKITKEISNNFNLYLKSRGDLIKYVSLNAGNIFGGEAVGTDIDINTVKDGLYKRELGLHGNDLEDKSSIVISTHATFNDQLYREIGVSEELDWYFENILANNPDVVAVYLGTTKEYTRYFPNIGLADLAPPDMITVERPWFVAANSHNNPNKEIVYTSVYEDAAANGLMVTAASPIYVDDELYGAIGLDITINSLFEKIRNETFFEGGRFMLLDEDMRTIVVPDELGNSILTNGELKFGEVITDKLEDRVKDIFDHIQQTDRGVINSENGGVIVSYETLESTGWKLIGVLNRDLFLSAALEVESSIDSSMVGFIIMMMSLIALVIVMIFVTTYSMFNRIFLKRILKLARSTKQVATGKLSSALSDNTGDEIGELTNSYNNMIGEVNKLTGNLEKEIEGKTCKLKEALQLSHINQLEMEGQKMATLNILEDVHDSQRKIEEANEMLRAQTQELKKLKKLGDDLTQVMGMEEAIAVINTYLQDSLNFSTATYLLVNPVEEGGLVYKTYLNEVVGEDYILESHKDIKKFLEQEQAGSLKWVNDIISNLRPSIFGKKTNNQSKSKLVSRMIFPLRVGEYVLGVVHISSSKSGVFGDVRAMTDAMLAAFGMSIARVHSLMMSQHSKTVSLVENLDDGVLMFNEDLSTILSNPKITFFVGIKKEQLSLIELNLKYKSLGLLKLAKRMMKSKEAVSLRDVEIMNKYYEMYILPVKDNNNRVTSGALLMHDITHLKEVDTMKTEFVSVASHQLRTPLTAIKLFTGMLLEEQMGKVSKDQKEYLQNIYDSTERMVRLVNDLLSLSRLESGKLEINPQKVILKEFVNTMINEVLPLAITKGVKVHFDYRLEDKYTLMLDLDLMRQVLSNLFTNAIRYSREGTGKIKIVVFMNKDNVQIEIEDNGIGVPKNRQSRIFEKFYRADNAVKSQTEGTGLGLYVSRMIVENSGGRIWFKSEENRGTTFFVSLSHGGMTAYKFKDNKSK